jgi:hypothetical protein
VTQPASSTPWASLGSIRIVSGTLSMPLYGAWVADVTLAVDTDVPTQTTLTIGNLSLVGYVVRQDSFAGLRTARLVGGHGGWMRAVTPKAYAMPPGTLLPLSMVLGDLAGDVGETVVTTLTTSPGNQWVREAASAQRALQQLSGGQWWIDPNGVTHVGPRTGVSISSPIEVIEYDGGRGAVRVATEDPASWLPGNSFSASTLPSALTISLVTHTLSSDGVARIDVLTTSSASQVDRLIASFRALVKTELPDTTFQGVYEYSVHATDGTTVDATPTSSGSSLPEITKVTLRSGLAGCTSTPAIGSLLVVAFLNGDQGKPFVVGGYDGTTAQSVVLGGPGASPLTPAAWATAMTGALATFVSGLTTSTLAAQASTLATALTALPSDATSIVRAQ